MKHLFLGVALGTAWLTCVAACGSSSSTRSTTQGSSSGTSSSGGGSEGGEFDAAGPTSIAGFTGVAACGQPVDAGALQFDECALSMPVSGGLSGYIDVPNLTIVCGSTSDANGIDGVDWGTNAGHDTSVSVSVTLPSPVPFDTTGSFPATIEIDVTALEGGMTAWRTPAGACSLAIVGSECVQLKGFDGGAREERILSGTGTCAQPAAPESGTSGAPVTIGTFRFLETIGP